MQGVRWIKSGLRNWTHMPAGRRTACGYRHTAQCRPPRGARRGVKQLIAAAVRVDRRRAAAERTILEVSLEKKAVGKV